MPISPSKYENGREGAFILGTLIPFINALEERFDAMEKQLAIVASKLPEKTAPPVTKLTSGKPKKLPSK